MLQCWYRFAGWRDAELKYRESSVVFFGSRTVSSASAVAGIPSVNAVHVQKSDHRNNSCGPAARRRRNEERRVTGLTFAVAVEVRATALKNPRAEAGWHFHVASLV